MKATRTIAGRPVNDSTTVADAIIELVAETVVSSPSIDSGEVRAELAGASSALALLAGGGHLRDGVLVLVAGTLRLQIEVPVGEGATTAETNASPPRGAATAEDWRLHLPAPAALEALICSVAEGRQHLTTDAAPAEAPSSAAKAVPVDLSRLREIGGVR